MEEKKRDYFRPLLTLAIALLSMFIGMKVSQFNPPKALQFMMPNSQNNKLSLVLDYIDKNYVDSVPLNEIAEKVIPEILKELDPHSVYIPASDMQDVNEPLQGNFDGIGVTFNMPIDTVIIMSVIPGGPSARAGVLSGDRIITVDDSLIAGRNMDQDSVVRLLRGKSGTKVTIGVERNHEKTLVNIPITRGKIPIKSIDVAYMVTPEIGYIRMARFARTTHDEFKEAVATLHSKGMTEIIVDLRGNTGGYLDQAFEIGNEFLPAGKLIVYTEGRKSKRADFYSNGSGTCATDNVVVLIDEGSASASEILAGAIQDNDRGTIIGRRSFGKGLVQEPVSFSDGSGLRLTIARYYTPTGRSIQKPYDKGNDEYFRDIRSRYEHGELEEVDSVHFDDSLRYTTPGGKIVYGGGGIMPDIFVPIDTTGVNPYFMSVSRRNYIFKYALSFSDEHRKELRDITTFDELEAFFAKQTLLKNFETYAAKQGIKASKSELAESAPIIEAHLKAYIGRNTAIDDLGFYPYINRVDITMTKAINELEKEKANQ